MGSSSGSSRTEATTVAIITKLSIAEATIKIRRAKRAGQLLKRPTKDEGKRTKGGKRDKGSGRGRGELERGEMENSEAKLDDRGKVSEKGSGTGRLSLKGSQDGRGRRREGWRLSQNEKRTRIYIWLPRDRLRLTPSCWA